MHTTQMNTAMSRAFSKCKAIHHFVHLQITFNSSQQVCQIYSVDPLKHELKSFKAIEMMNTWEDLNNKWAILCLEVIWDGQFLR